MKPSQQSVAARFLTRWEAFWFQPVPPQSFALLRIALGALGFIGVISVTPVSMFWAPDGMLSVSGAGVRGVLVDLGLGTVAGWTLFLGLLVSFACMTVGYRTGTAVVLCFIGSVVQQAVWNRLPLSGAHQVTVVILFCLMWADCSGYPSVDAWLAARRGGDSVPRDTGQPIWPLRLIRFQIAWIYLTTGLWKLFGAPWRDGSAIHYVLNLNTYARFPDGVPPSLSWLTTLATYTTLFWELAFLLLLLHRWTRRAALLIGLVLHVGMAATLELGLFSWVMVASYLAFLDPHFVSRVMTTRLATPRSKRRPYVGEVAAANS